MPQNRSTSTRLVALVVALAIGVTGFVAGGTGAPAGAAAPTEAPTIIGPDGTTVGQNPVLQWEAIAGVTKYRVQVSTSSSFSGNPIWQADVVNVSATPWVDLPLGTLYWRVAGMDGSAVGPYGSASFTRGRLDGPQLLAPADGSTLEYPSEPVVLRWEPVPGVKNYRVEVDDAPDFIGAKTATTDATNWALLETQPLGQTFYWRVQGQGSANGVNTEFSSTWSYSLSWAQDGTPSVPQLIEPAAGAEVTDVVFRWQPVAGAAKYNIQVSPNGNWANNVVIDEEVVGTSFSPAITLNNSSYFWRVQALSVRSSPDAGPWSPDGRQFTRSWADVPVLREPVNGDVTAEEYLLRWDPVPFASAYEINIGTDSNFSPSTYQSCTTTHTDWAPYWREGTDPNLPPRPGGCALGDNENHRLTYLRHGVRYYWRVRGLDQTPTTSTTILGRFSEVRSFVYLPDGAGLPEPLAPTPGSVTGVPQMRWKPVRGAEAYQVSVYVDGDRVQVARTADTTYTPSLNLPADGDAAVRWEVTSLQTDARGGSSVGGTGPLVDGGTFTLTAEAGTSGTPTPVAPAPGAEVVAPTFDWAPVPDASYYAVRLYIAGSPVFEEIVDHNEGDGRSRNPYRSTFTPTEPITPGAYEWQVVAYDVAGGVLSSSSKVPVAIAPLAVVTPTAPASCAQGQTCTVELSTPLMRWNPVAHAGVYRVWVALDPEFTNVRHIYTTTQTALRPTEALPDNQAGQSYYWFVQPCRTLTACGRADSTVFHTARAFRKASRPIALTSPANQSRVGDLVTFRWSAPSAQWDGADANDDVEAKTYLIEVATSANFGSTTIDSAEVDQRTYTPWDRAKQFGTYPEGPLYWRVQARDASGNLLTSSPTWQVTKASPRPVVTSPSNGDESNSAPVIQWDPQPFAASYQLEYYRNGDTAWTAGNLAQTTNTQLPADTMLKALAPGTYAYRVRRLDVEGRPGPWSSDPPPGSSNPADGDRRTFVVVGSEPSPTAPDNGTVFSRPRVRLEWDPVPGAASYKVETSSSAGFGTLIDSQTTVMTAWSLVKGHTNGTIYWKVTALNPQGGVMGVSDVRSFVHDLSRPTAVVTSAVAGPATALVRWTAQAVTAVGPITSFEVTPYVGTTRGTPVTVPGSAREAQIDGLLNGTTYTFTVTPYDANGVGVESPRAGAAKPSAVAPFTHVDRFIDRQVQDFWGRRPTTTELNQFRSQMGGGMTAQAFIASLWNHPNHANLVPQIARLYSAYYLRIPDQGGLAYWIGERRRGVSLDAISQSFTRTPEFRTLYGQLDNRGFVALVYTNVLGRPASSTDMTYWTGQLNRGVTRGVVMRQFSEAPENRTKTQHEINAALIYLEMLRRTPTVDERDALADDLRDGQSLNQAFLEMMTSAAYAPRAT